MDCHSGNVLETEAAFKIMKDYGFVDEDGEEIYEED